MTPLQSGPLVMAAQFRIPRMLSPRVANSNALPVNKASKLANNQAKVNPRRPDKVKASRPHKTDNLDSKVSKAKVNKAKARDNKVRARERANNKLRPNLLVKGKGKPRARARVSAVRGSKAADKT